MNNQIRESLRSVCENLNNHGVEYILVGGVAVGFHGWPRSTADIDIWYNPTIENFQRIIAALDEHKVDTSDLKEIVFNPKTTFLRILQLGFRTEFLPTIAGLDSFRKAFQSATKTELDGVRVVILSYEDLILNKESAGRPRDIQDVDELRKRRST